MREAQLRLGIARAASPADLAARSEMVLTLVDRGADVEAQFDGPSGLQAGVHSATLMVITTSFPPNRLRSLAHRVLEQTAGRLRLVDAPLSGPRSAVLRGELSIPVGAPSWWLCRGGVGARPVGPPDPGRRHRDGPGRPCLRTAGPRGHGDGAQRGDHDRRAGRTGHCGAAEQLGRRRSAGPGSGCGPRATVLTIDRGRPTGAGDGHAIWPSQPTRPTESVCTRAWSPSSRSWATCLIMRA